MEGKSVKLNRPSRKCRQCNKAFSPNSVNQVYCSYDCRNKNKNENIHAECQAEIEQLNKKIRELNSDVGEWRWVNVKEIQGYRDKIKKLNNMIEEYKDALKEMYLTRKYQILEEIGKNTDAKTDKIIE